METVSRRAGCKWHFCSTYELATGAKRESVTKTPLLPHGISDFLLQKDASIKTNHFQSSVPILKNQSVSYFIAILYLKSFTLIFKVDFSLIAKSSKSKEARSIDKKTSDNRLQDSPLFTSLRIFWLLGLIGWYTDYIILHKYLLQNVFVSQQQFLLLFHFRLLLKRLRWGR